MERGSVRSDLLLLPPGDSFSAGGVRRLAPVPSQLVLLLRAVATLVAASLLLLLCLSLLRCAAAADSFGWMIAVNDGGAFDASRGLLVTVDGGPQLDAVC